MKEKPSAPPKLNAAIDAIFERANEKLQRRIAGSASEEEPPRKRRKARKKASP